jgi:four helix bundle protein
MDDQPRDLCERTFQFAKAVRLFVRKLPKTISNIEDVKQLVRSSGSVGANYIEAQEALSRKDFRYRVCVSRKEAKESAYWLRLLNTGNVKAVEVERQHLLSECGELLRILSAIINRAIP